MPSLDGASLKLSRAKYHFKIADDLVEGIKNRTPYRIVSRFIGNGNTRECLLSFEQVEDAPIELSLVIGDICNNLRSALDHLIWQLWLIKNPAFDRSVYFPICDCECAFNRKAPRDIGRSAEDGLTDSQRANIKSLQPYRTNNPALSILRDVNDSDKHRLIQVIGIVVDVSHIQVTADPAMILRKSIMPNELCAFKLFPNVKVKNGAVIARIPIDTSGLGMNVRVQSKTIVQYAFDGSKSADGQLIRQSLDAMISEVSRIIDIFRSEFI